jgi:hypothetical protein
MNLTKEQSLALREQSSLRLNDPETQTVYVVLQAAAYEKMVRQLLQAGEVDPDEFLPMVNEIMAEDDADDPLLESYQK